MTLLPRRPRSWTAWKRMPERDPFIGAEAWRLGRDVLVVSSLDLAEFRGVVTPQWHVTISCFGKRAPDHVVVRVLRDFGIPTAEEDNHFPGVARNFWRLCDLAPNAPQVCDCKETEETVVEPDGFTWQRERRP